MSDTFFRFPLRALSAFEGPFIRLETLVGYCVMDVGYKLVEPAEKAELTPDYHRELAWHRGCAKLNVRSTGKGADQRMQMHYEAVQTACGLAAQATVSIRTQWLWNCLYELRGDAEMAEMPLSYREFSLLCAILSKLGDKDMDSCTWREIQCRALGYTTKAEMERVLPLRKDGAKALSRQQIRSTLDDLERNKFFGRWSFGNGERSWLGYFSFKRMSRAKLAERATALYAQRRRRGPLRRSPEDKQLAADQWAALKKRRRAESPTTPPSA